MTTQKAHIFVVDDAPEVAHTLARTLESDGMEATVFSCLRDCLVALSRQSCDLIVTDMCLQDGDGLSLLHKVRRRFPWLQVIVVTAYGTIPLTVAAMKAGAATLLEKPLDRSELLTAVKTALENSAQPASFPREPLSRAEAAVLRLFLKGLTSRQTAIALNRATRTIEAHRHSLMRKFGVHNAVLLAQKASALWWDDQEDSRKT